MSFSETYLQARDRFRESSLRAGGDLSALEIEYVGDAGPLTIDIAVFGSANQTLLVSSGVHGVEGFAGSAIQLELLAAGLPSDLRVVLVHTVNPYGMAYGRRANENNVDLNRNCLLAGKPYRGASEGYRALYDLLHPQTPHRAGLDAFLARAVLEIVRRGMPALRQAVAGGQYDFPMGLFWGGDKLQPGPAILLDALPDLLAGAQRLVALDLHSGLGRQGTYALLANADPDSEQLRTLTNAYGPRVQPNSPDESVAYEVSGGFIDAVAASFEGECDSLVAEFGTCSPIAVIRAMRAENRAHFWGGDAAHAQQMLRDAFYPESATWREAILRGGREIFDRAVARLRTTHWS